MTILISDRVFENMVNADLRDKDGTGFAWEVLRAPVNRSRWLTALIGIRESINVQNAHDNAILKAHPGKSSGAPTPGYVQARADHAERRRPRMRTMQAVMERITEAQQLIGTLPVSQVTAGRLAVELVDIDRILAEGSIEGARTKLQLTIKTLTAPEGASL